MEHIIAIKLYAGICQQKTTLTQFYMENFGVRAFQQNVECNAFEQRALAHLRVSLFFPTARFSGGEGRAVQRRGVCGRDRCHQALQLIISDHLRVAAGEMRSCTPSIHLCQGQVILEKQSKDERNETALPGAKTSRVKTQHARIRSARCQPVKQPLACLDLPYTGGYNLNDK